MIATKCEDCMRCSYLYCEESFNHRVQLKCKKGYDIMISREHSKPRFYQDADLLGIRVYEFLENYSMICDKSMKFLGLIHNNDVLRYRKEYPKDNSFYIINLNYLKEYCSLLLSYGYIEAYLNDDKDRDE